MKNLRSWTTRQLALVLAGVALLGGSAAVFAADLRPHPAGQLPATAGHAVPSVEPAPAQYNPTTPRPAAPTPQRIAIPAIGVDATVEAVTVNDRLEMATPARPVDTGWYSLGSSPGEDGDAVIDGHVDSPDGAPAVFARLAQLKPGDQLIVTLAEGRRTFAVTRIASVPYHSVPAGLFATQGPPLLTLITCTGAWDPAQGVYSQRLVVEATLV